jgi:hypothetical protein
MPLPAFDEQGDLPVGWLIDLASWVNGVGPSWPPLPDRPSRDLRPSDPRLS